MDVTEFTPTRALQVITPPGLAVETRFESPPPSWHRRPWRSRLTVAWERDGDEAARMMGHVDRVARELIGPDAPMLVRSGEIGIPLQDGDRDRPGDARFAGRVFAEIEGDLSLLLDARRQPARPLDLWDAAAREFAGRQSLVCAQVYLFAFERRVRIQLASILAVRRGAPGWEAWDPAASATA